MQSPYEPNSIKLAEHETVIVKTALALVSAVPVPGLSFVGSLSPAIEKHLERRVNRLRDALLEGLRAGELTEADVYSEDDLASFVLRLRRAAMEGCAASKLRMMSAYFFQNAREPAYKEDDFLVTATIIEQLADNELRALAVIDNAVARGKLCRPSEVKQGESQTTIFSEDIVELCGLFATYLDFRASVIPLVRFGFVDLDSGWGQNNPSATERLFVFLSQVDVGHWRGK